MVVPQIASVARPSAHLRDSPIVVVRHVVVEQLEVVVGNADDGLVVLDDVAGSGRGWLLVAVDGHVVPV